jgi:hypothetical protein
MMTFPRRPMVLSMLCCLFTLLSATACVSAAPTPTRLAVNGKAQLPVVVSANASKATRAAAADLATYLGRISGGEFAVQEGTGDAGIVVGTAADFAKLPFATDFGTGPLDREDYVLKSTSDGLWLIGATEMAVEHAVWDALYRIGYRQFFPGETWEVVPSETNLSLAVDAKERPDFHTRRIWYNWGMWGYNNQPYAEWTYRNRARQGFRLNSGHAYGAIMSAKAVEFKAHPEYFASIEGKRENRGGDSKFCVGNEGLRKLVVEYAVESIKRNPDLDSVSMDPSDGGGWCDDTCDLCKTVGSGSVSDRVLTLANEVAVAINELGLGNKYVGMYAYNRHSAPPTIKADPRVIASVTTAFLTGGWSFDQVVKGWQAQGTTIGVYDYFTVIAWDWNQPRAAKAARPHNVAGSLVSFHDMGARYFDAESGDAWGPYGLGFYVASRVLWDIDEAKRIEEIIDDFLTRAFGPAKQPMSEFYNLIGVDTQRRSAEDMIGRMYRHLAEARTLAANQADVVKRIDDLILYTRYYEMYHRQASATGDAQGKARDAMISFVWRIRTTMMVHAYGIMARTVGQGAVAQPDFALKDERPITEADIQEILANGIKNNEPVNLAFDTKEFSDDLIPAAKALKLPQVAAGSYPTNPQDQHTYHVWVEKAPAEINLKVTVQKVWATRPHEITLYSPKDVTITRVDQSTIVQPDGKTYDVVLKTPYDGLHTIGTRDGGDYTRIQWPQGMAVTVPSGLDKGTVGTQFRGPWTMYVYVPKGTKVVAGWGARIANWAPRISGTLKDGDGNVMIDFGKLEDGWFHVDVPAGQDGKLWKFENNQGIRQMVTVPPYFAVTAEDLLLPREVVEADSK